MIELITNAELKEHGRLIVDKDTRKAGDLKQGDILQLTIVVVKRASKKVI